MQRPVCKIKSGKKRKRFKREYLNQGRECFVRANIHNQSKLSFDRENMRIFWLVFHSKWHVLQKSFKFWKKNLPGMDEKVSNNFFPNFIIFHIFLKKVWKNMKEHFYSRYFLKTMTPHLYTIPYLCDNIRQKMVLWK